MSPLFAHSRAEVDASCPDCAAQIGERHDPNCDVARCSHCGWQRLQNTDHPGNGGVWTGAWPGELEAIELGLWCRWGPQWIRCSADHPDARPDLNALARMASTGEVVWNTETARWERPAA